jgi:hypothetical protein
MFHLPHNSMIAGYEYVEPDNEAQYYSFRLHLFILSICIDWD